LKEKLSPSTYKPHLEEHIKVDSLCEAATMADDYALTHKLSCAKCTLGNQSFHDKKKPF